MTIFVILLSFASSAFSSGWHDYKLDIADDLSIMRMNSFQVCLGRPDNTILLCPDFNQSEFGPITAYQLTNDKIFTKHSGAKPYDKNPSMLVADRDVTLYFITDRKSGSYSGPLNEEEFLRRENIREKIDWAIPKNPNKWTPFWGNLMFVLFTFIYYGAPLILIGIVGLVLYKIVKRRKNA